MISGGLPSPPQSMTSPKTNILQVTNLPSHRPTKTKECPKTRMGVIKSSPHRLIVVMMLFSPLFFTNRRDREYGWSKLSTHHVLWLWTCNALPLPNTISNHSGNAHCSFFYKKNKQKTKQHDKEHGRGWSKLITFDDRERTMPCPRCQIRVQI